MMIERIAPSLLKSWLHDGQEVALLDVRLLGKFDIVETVRTGKVVMARGLETT